MEKAKKLAIAPSEKHRERPFEPCRIPHHTWTDLVADELAHLAGDYSATDVERAWCLARAPRVRGCGRTALVQRCRCGTAIPGSVHALPGAHGWCETRGCPVCSRRRSAKLAGLADRAAAAVPEGSSWWLLTGTTARDPFDPEACTWQALRARARRCRVALGKVVKLARRRWPVSSAWAGIELAGNGHIHAHLLISIDHGTIPDRGLLEATIRASGFDEVADAREASPAAVVEVVKYSVKSPSWESAIDPDTDRPRMAHPVIAARFALATRAMRLSERYGLARKVKLEVPEVREVPEAPEVVACPGCGGTEENDRWWFRGASHRVADWARRTWKGKEGLRLCGQPWPREGPGKTAVAVCAAELFPVFHGGYSLDKPQKSAY